MRVLTGWILTLSLVAFQITFASVGRTQDASEQDLINSLLPRSSLLGPSRGIRAAHEAAMPQAASNTAASPASAGSAAVDTSRLPSVNLQVEFVTGSAELTRTAARTLNTVGRVLTSNKLQGYRFRIEGHTDTVGDRDGNRLLSERRAVRVVEYLVRHYHVDPGRLDPVGAGEDGLLIPTPDQTAEPHNRRVQIFNLGT